MRKNSFFRHAILTFIIILFTLYTITAATKYPVVDTDQSNCYDVYGRVIPCPSAASSVYGQDAQYTRNAPSYTNNGDGTITDNVTGLMWQQDPGSKMTHAQAVAGASSFDLGGYSDWRLPSIKELYSLIRFNGTDPSINSSNTSNLIPFINTDYFAFQYGDTSAGERIIDSQFTTSSKYVHTTMNGEETVFGVNFADGRIKGYGITEQRTSAGKKFYVLYVRGNTQYGINQFVDNGDGSITDNATGLMWMQNDSGHLGANNNGALNWAEALDWAESSTIAGHSDWRLPNAKELQSIVDYSRSPATSNSPAIDPIFNTTAITDEGGSKNYPFYWTSTTHANWSGNGPNSAYVCFGEALGWMQFGLASYQLMDVHGAGAQRSDSKTGDPSLYPYGHGPQGDVVRIYHYVRCVRTATVSAPTTYTLSVHSSESGAAVTVSPEDNNSSGSGTASFTRTYNSGTFVTLTAPATHNGKTFSKWNAGGSESTNTSVQVTMSANITATAYYSSDNSGGGGSVDITVSKERLNFGVILKGSSTQDQELYITGSGTDSFTWTAVSDSSWLNLNKTSGSGNGMIYVSVNSSSLSAQTYYGHITVSSPQAGSSQSVLVCLKVLQNSTAPFGNYATPANNAHVSSSVAFTGWVLDDVAVSSVKLYREWNGTLFYIGDASLVEGARPDVEGSYPDYPNNSRAGWGYMLLTQFLPGGGNGTYVIHAIATDDEGQQTTLGTRTIIVDNANAVKPFGAIDTPAQGGTASGNTYICWGWALTPWPNSIATDGSTIDVWVDGVNIGHPTYNIFRSDIAGLFPGYANSNGAIGYFSLDTTAYEDGIHTIQWTVKDSAGNSDGIGSRYFSIRNSSSSRQSVSSQPLSQKTMYKKFSDLHSVNVKEMQRLQVVLSRNNSNHQWQGYMLVDNQLKPLPIGSTLDNVNGVFYWLPGPGFYGKYSFIFFNGSAAPARINVSIGNN